MVWKQDKRLSHFKRILEDNGTQWMGTNEQLIDFLYYAIPSLPGYLKEPMERYYIKGSSRIRNEEGLHTSEDALFYQHLRAGRAALSFLIKLCGGDPGTALSLVKEN